MTMTQREAISHAAATAASVEAKKAASAALHENILWFRNYWRMPVQRIAWRLGVSKSCVEKHLRDEVLKHER